MIAGRENILVLNLGASGLLHTDVTFSYKKPSSLSFESFVLTETNFLEAQFGYYNVTFPATLSNEIGEYIFKAESTSPVIELYKSEQSNPMPLASVPPADLCVVTGNIKDLSGKYDSFENVVVMAMPLRLPLQNNGSFVLGKRVVTYANFDGFFALPLTRGMTVLFEIKDAGVRFQAEIPDLDTVRLEDLMP